MTWRSQTFSLLRRDRPARQPETLGFLKEENLRRAASHHSVALVTLRGFGPVNHLKSELG